MSFRLRVLVLIMYVAVTATAATTWLTLRQASRQIEESVAASQQQALLISEGLRAYGLSHGTWDGVATEVGDLARRTGQRIRVVTDSGRLLADSDILAGGTPRHVVGAPLLIDARPTLRLPEGRTPAVMARLTILAIHRFRQGAPYAACLTRAGGAVTASPGSDGVPVYASRPSVTGCSQTPPVGRAGGQRRRASLHVAARGRGCRVPGGSLLPTDQ